MESIFYYKCAVLALRIPIQKHIYIWYLILQPLKLAYSQQCPPRSRQSSKLISWTFFFCDRIFICTPLETCINKFKVLLLKLFSEVKSQGKLGPHASVCSMLLQHPASHYVQFRKNSRTPQKCIVFKC